MLKFVSNLLIKFLEKYFSERDWLLTEIHSTIPLISTQNIIILISILFIRNCLCYLFVHCLRSYALSLKLFLFFCYAIFADILMFRLRELSLWSAPRLQTRLDHLHLGPGLSKQRWNTGFFLGPLIHILLLRLLNNGRWHRLTTNATHASLIRRYTL